MLKPRNRQSRGQIPIREFSECPAKTFQNGCGETEVGRSVVIHCKIVGEVARELIRRIPVESVRELFPSGAAFAAGCHDNGKVSPTFYNKIIRACSGELLPGFDPDLEKAWGGHAGVSQLTAKALGAPEYVPAVLGQHHGFSPPVSGRRAADECFGGVAWQREREKLVEHLERYFNETWPDVKSIPQARLLAGLTSVADWIGSGHYFEDPRDPWEDNIEAALDAAGFVPANYVEGLSFEQVFGFSPREAQSTLISQITVPGVYVAEFPMSEGKTEAALHGAYQLLSSGQASGVYFALPTQLTSNKIFERFNAFLGRILAPDCEHRSLLLHANSWLLTDMGEEGRPGGAWFNSAKRGLLAPFAVGTIDQALMAAMNVKHGFVRAFGLAGKVVILDEVHTYDAYTGTLLDSLVQLLRSLHCTVIILSATLNQERRAQLLGCSVSADDYPLVTASTNTGELHEVAVPASPSKYVNVCMQPDDSAAIEEALSRAAEGQQVLWIENTVADAQRQYQVLASRAGESNIACSLLHSRFTVQHRQEIEEQWVNLFGKAGWERRGRQGRILVGTQVLEQSLDIDADFMVTRFAPTDMLLQRMGRVWRHEDTPRSKYAKREVWLLAPDLKVATMEPKKSFGRSTFVYSPYVLCRSLEVWQSIERVRLPEDIRGLIESTYASREESGNMLRWLNELEDGTGRRLGRKGMRQLALVALSEGGKTLPEYKAETRYSEVDNFEVLLLRAISLSEEGDMVALTLLNGETVKLPLQRSCLTKAQWREYTAKLMRHLVSVRAQDAPSAVAIENLKRFGLHHCFYLGNPDWPTEESVLRVALVDDAGRLRGLESRNALKKCSLQYQDDLGYQVVKP